jgi:hypothetical protein
MQNNRLYRKKQFRELLRKYPDGLTDRMIAQRCGVADSDRANKILEAMGDAYIDRWVKGTKKFPWRPVWCVVEVPDNCPHPEEKAGE